ncbi:MAG: Mov34/MPN/PAD-1 family protein [Nitrososphaerales archaeon]
MQQTKIILDQVSLEEIHSHAALTYPEECCGLLVGKFEDNSLTKRVNGLKKMENAFAKEERYHRYTIDPREFMNAESEAESSGEEVVGIYHSHPDSPATPSRFDIDHAWPSLSYLLVEVRNAEPVATMSWLLKEDRTGFLPENIEIIATTAKLGNAGGARFLAP